MKPPPDHTASEPSRWVPKGETVRIHGRDIGGMVYVGPGRLPQPEDVKADTRIRLADRQRWYLDPRKTVAPVGDDFDGKGVHLWAGYSDLEERPRATYLDWLAGGRRDSRYSPRYALLYFYGLERRVFLDRTEPTERADIVAEVERLRSAYSHDAQVGRAFAHFIDACRLLDPDFVPQPVFASGRPVPLSVSLALSRLVSRGEGIPADWTLSWLFGQKLFLPERELLEEFRALYAQMFEARLPDGVHVPESEEQLQLWYRAASREFQVDISPTGEDLRGIAHLHEYMDEVKQVAEAASAELAPYWQLVRSSPELRGTLRAHRRLPGTLLNLIPCEGLEELRAWLDARAASGDVMPVEDVIERLDGVRPQRVAPGLIARTADTLATLGFGLSPDPRFAPRAPQGGEAVVVFRLGTAPADRGAPSNAYRQALCALSVGTLIAHADRRFGRLEREHLAARIDANTRLTEAERRRLRADLARLEAVPPQLTLVRTRLQGADGELGTMLGQLALSVAGADGVVDQNEILLIERVYEMLGLDPRSVHDDLHLLASSAGPATTDEADAAAVALDPKRIDALLADTDRVNQLLGGIFGADDEPDDVWGGEAGAGGLDEKHKALVTALVGAAAETGRGEWTTAEFAVLVKSQRLMVDGAVETINEWAYERFEDALIEHGDGYELNAAVVASMQEE